jgi:hypothetical protein
MQPEVWPEKALAPAQEYSAFRARPPGHVRRRRLRDADLARTRRDGGLHAKQLVTNWIISYYAPKDP